MEMTLPTRYAPQLPHSDCHPRQDNRQGVPLRRRFLAAAARGAGSSTAKKKNLLLQHPARVQSRLLCSPFEYIVEEREEGPENGTASFAVARNRLQEALATNHRQQMLDALGVLKEFAGDKDYYDVEYKATDLLLTAVSPLAYLSLGGGKHGGGGGLDLDDDVVKESLAVACLLLRNAPAKIRTTLWGEISQEKGVKTSLERIRDSGDEEVCKLAKEILTQIPPSAPN